MPKWSKMASAARRALKKKPAGWFKKLGRPLSAAEVEAYLGLVKPCPGYLLAAEDPNHPTRSLLDLWHPLVGWWEVGRGQYARCPHLDAVWDLAVKRELRRRKEKAKT